MRAILAAALTGAALFTAAPAQADQWDFISKLDDTGVPYESILDMFTLGKQTCHELRAGTPLSTLGNKIVSYYGYQPIEAAIIIHAASDTMCYDTAWRIEEAKNRGGIFA